jgi:iron donor protein CyaY
METESEYRARVQLIFESIEKVFEKIDPDLAECEQSQGAMTLSFADASRCILSAQPSVRQIWLALAARGTAYHFNFNETSRTWNDDKGRGIELLQCLEGVLREQTGKNIVLVQKLQTQPASSSSQQ